MEKSVEVIAAAIILNNNKDKILLIKRKDKLGGDSWSIPGGHVEFGEKIIDSLKRELKEELDLYIISSEFFDLEEIILKNKHMISFDYLVIANENIEINDEIDSAEWIEFNKLPNVDHKLSNQILNKLKKII